MLNTLYSRRGMVTSPHHLASQAGLSILKEGGTSIDAAIAVASVLSVVYPHMLSIGGDAFWLIGCHDKEPMAIEACGRSGSNVNMDLYKGYESIPVHGPLAVNSVAGAVSGWAAAFTVSKSWGTTMTLSRILQDAIYYAREGVPISVNTSVISDETKAALLKQPTFCNVFAPDGTWPATGSLMKQPALAATLIRLAEEGLDSFYRGNLAKDIAADLKSIGSPLTLGDLQAHQASERTPIHIDTSKGRFYNFPPPTQGATGLHILGQFDRLGIQPSDAETFPHIHGFIEASKQAYQIRRIIADPDAMTESIDTYLTPEALNRLASQIDMKKAKEISSPSGPGDTAWLGVMDCEGRAVSCIQSVFHPFGSGTVLPTTGILWQNRGTSFSLDKTSVNALVPGKRPFHTLNPAMAKLKDGRFITYGTMGAHGQPQISSNVIIRYAWLNEPLQSAVTAPRWMVDGDRILVENRLSPTVVEELRKAGHRMEWTGPYETYLGHAHGIVRRPDGTLEGATDPRADGIVAAY